MVSGAIDQGDAQVKHTVWFSTGLFLRDAGLIVPWRRLQSPCKWPFRAVIRGIDERLSELSIKVVIQDKSPSRPQHFLYFLPLPLCKSEQLFFGELLLGVLTVTNL